MEITNVFGTGEGLENLLDLRQFGKLFGLGEIRKTFFGPGQFGWCFLHRRRYGKGFLISMSHRHGIFYKRNQTKGWNVLIRKRMRTTLIIQWYASYDQKVNQEAEFLGKEIISSDEGNDGYRNSLLPYGFFLKVERGTFLARKTLTERYKKRGTFELPSDSSQFLNSYFCILLRFLFLKSLLKSCENIRILFRFPGSVIRWIQMLRIRIRHWKLSKDLRILCTNWLLPRVAKWFCKIFCQFSSCHKFW